MSDENKGVRNIAGPGEKYSVLKFELPVMAPRVVFSSNDPVNAYSTAQSMSEAGYPHSVSIVWKDGDGERRYTSPRSIFLIAYDKDIDFLWVMSFDALDSEKAQEIYRSLVESTSRITSLKTRYVFTEEEGHLGIALMKLRLFTIQENTNRLLGRVEKVLGFKPEATS